MTVSPELVALAAGKTLGQSPQGCPETRYDGYWENGLNQWDVAAGILIVREAGGFVTEISGRRYELGAPDILAANDSLHEPLVGLFANASAKDK